MKKRKKEKQRVRNKEFRKWRFGMWKERKKKDIAEDLDSILPICAIFCVISILGGIFGFFVGIMQGSGEVGFIIGLCFPLIVIVILIYVRQIID